MRVLFLSDTHLGLDLPARPRVVRRRRGHDFFRNFELALEACHRDAVDVVVHGGDLLYRSRVPASLVDAALAPLKRVASRGVPVLLVPGNHERGRLPYPLLALHDGLHVFDRPHTVLLQARGVRVAFTGFPYMPAIRDRFNDAFAAATRDVHAADLQVLCIHQVVEGATCGPGAFAFRFGPDVIRATDLPRGLAVTLSGHIHRHQVLTPVNRCPVIYAGSIERTSFAEEGETKGYVMLELARSGLERVEFNELPARPMVTRHLSLAGAGHSDAMARVAAALDSTPEDAVVRLRVTGSIPPTLTAAVLRSLAGARNVSVREFAPAEPFHESLV
ncbi:MAG: metallophosphoesterase family protein [Bacteroidales bacterium]